jgi:hypothetical protein
MASKASLALAALVALALAKDCSAALPRTVAHGRVPGHQDVTRQGAPAKGDTVIQYTESKVCEVLLSRAAATPHPDALHPSLPPNSANLLPGATFSLALV